MKKALIVTSYFHPSVGGEEEQARLIGEELLKRGYAVNVVTANHHPSEWQDFDSYGNIEIIRYRSMADFVRILIKNRNEYEFGIVKQYFVKSAIVGCLKWLGILRFPTLVSPDFGSDEDSEIAIVKRTLRWEWLFRFYFFLVGKNDFLNCTNESFAQQIRAVLGDTPKIRKIYNGMEIRRVGKRPNRKIRNVLFLARLVKEKGIFELIKAFGRIENPELRLRIVGKGLHEIETDVSRAAELDPRIEFLGIRTGEAKWKAFEDADVFVTPSYNEGQPTTVFEAAMFGLPIVTTDNGDIRSIFGDRLRYVEKRNVESLKKALENELSKNDTDWEDYSDVLKEFDISAAVESYLGCLKS